MNHRGLLVSAAVVGAFVVGIALGRGHADDAASPAPASTTSTTLFVSRTQAPVAFAGRASTTVITSVGESRAGVVTHVVDGDTVDVDGVRIRLIGYDTPERGQCGYAEAKARVEQLVGGQTVDVVAVAGRDRKDRYGRELAYIRRGDMDLGRVLIGEGLAHARYDGLDGYGTHPLQDEYRALDASTPNRCDR